MNIIVPSLIVALSVAFLGFGGLKYADAYRYYVNFSYYVVLAGVFVWFFKLCCFIPCKRAVCFLLKRHCAVFLTAAAIVSFMFFAASPELRILADETNLLSVSQSMYEDHSILNTTQKLYSNHNYYERVTNVLEKRPLLYPMTLSFVHSFLGYSYKNAFLLNGISAFVSLILIYFIALPYLGRFFGFSAMLFAASFPLLVLYTSSAGFDVFNMTWSLILFAAVKAFLKRKNAQRAEFVLYTTLMFAQTRYESAVSIALAIPIILCFLKKEKYKNFSLACVAYPVFWLPIVILNRLSYNPKALQVNSLEDAFGVGNFIRNFKYSISFFFGERMEYGIPKLAALLAALGVVFLLARLFKRKTKTSGFNSRVFCAFAVLFYLINAVIKFSYYYGNFTFQYNSRLGIIFIPAMAFLAAYSLKGILSFFSVNRVAAILIPVFSIFYCWPAAGQNLAVRELTLFRQFKYVREFLEVNYPNKKEYLLVAPRANLYVPLNYSVLFPEYFNENYDYVMDDIYKGLRSGIIVVQNINRKIDEPERDSIINNASSLVKLHEYFILNDNIIRISKIDFK